MYTIQQIKLFGMKNMKAISKMTMSLLFREKKQQIAWHKIKGFKISARETVGKKNNDKFYSGLLLIFLCSLSKITVCFVKSSSSSMCCFPSELE